jgi:predicted MFS family arabinose efflux permease
MSSRPRPHRRVSAGVYAALFLGATTQAAITPLLPRIEARYGVSEAAVGLLVAAPAIMVLALCVPIGLLADRLGARRLTIAAAGLLGVTALGQAIPSFAAILVARLLFGVAFGTLLTAGIAWLSQDAGPGGSTRLGATVTSTSVGTIVGPVIGGLLGEGVGLGVPFIAAGGAGLLIALALLACPVQARRDAHERARASLRDLAAAARDRGVRAGAGALAISGAVGGATQLLVPLQLHAAHLSAGAIGVAFSAAAVVYIVTSAAVVAAGTRAISLRINAIAALAISLALVPAALSASVVAVVATLLATSLPRSTVGTISYPLATGGGARTGLGSGVSIGVVNAAWAAGVVAAPLLAGALTPAIGVRGVYGVLLVVTCVGALALRRGGIPASPTPASAAPASATAASPTPASAAPASATPASPSPAPRPRRPAAARAWGRQLRVARRSDA